MKKLTLLAMPFAIGLLVAVANPSAAAAAPDNFGQHVSTCAQTMGFGADHNPGKHYGASGWDGTHC